MNLPPLGRACFVTGEPFAAGERVLSQLVRDPQTGAVTRYDAREPEQGRLPSEGVLVCRWVQVFKARLEGDNSEREMKLTAENLFLTLADPQAVPTTESARLLQFLALMLERKRVLKPRGRTPDGGSHLYEHAKTKQAFEVPAVEMDEKFFREVGDQLGAVVGVG